MRIGLKPFMEYVSRNTPRLGDIGEKVMNNPSYKKVNNLVSMDGKNFQSMLAFLLLMFGFVLTPRVLVANERDNGTGDEIREILTRDVAAIFTLVFAWKGIHSLIMGRFCNLMLLNKPEKTVKGFFNRLHEYFKPSGGLDALKESQFVSKYSGFGKVKGSDKFDEEQGVKQFGGLLNWLEKSGYDPKRVLTFDKNKKGGGELNNITKEIFKNDDFESMSASEVVKRCSEPDNAKKYIDVLNDDSRNPLLAYATKINTWFTAASLAVMTAFLGFGLPMFNEAFTNRKYLNRDGGIRPEYENPHSLSPPAKVAKAPALKDMMPKEQRMAFNMFG